MLTVKQVAERLGVQPSTVYAAVQSGVLKCHRIRCRPGSRGAIRITEEQLRAYLEGPPEEAPPKSRAPSGKTTFSQLDASRLQAAWERQGVVPPSA